MVSDLGGGLTFFRVKLANLLVIEEFRGEGDWNKINEIAGVRTEFGLVDHFLSPKNPINQSFLRALST